MGNIRTGVKKKVASQKKPRQNLVGSPEPRMDLISVGNKTQDLSYLV